MRSGRCSMATMRVSNIGCFGGSPPARPDKLWVGVGPKAANGTTEISGAMDFCPVCMLRKGLAGGVESGESSTEDTLKPRQVGADQRFDHYELVRAKTVDRWNWVAERCGSLTRRRTSICAAP